MRKYSNEEINKAKMVADALIEKLVDKISQDFDEGSQDWTIIQAAKGYEVEVYPDGTCDLIHESEYEEPEEEDPCTDKVGKERIQCPKCGSCKADREAKP